MIQKLIYAVAVTALTAYQSTFLIGEIGLSMTEASLVAAVEAAIYAIALAVFGKLGERISLSRVYAIGMILMTFAAFFCIFLSPTSFLVPYILFALCYRCGYAAFMVGFFVVYRVIPESHYTSSGAVINIPQCLLVFLTTLVLAPLFNYLKLDLDNTLFGHTFYAQQTFAVLGTVLHIVSLLYLFLVVHKRIKKEMERSALL
jgi:MFS family permease